MDPAAESVDADLEAADPAEGVCRPEQGWDLAQRRQHVLLSLLHGGECRDGLAVLHPAPDVGMVVAGQVEREAVDLVQQGTGHGVNPGVGEQDGQHRLAEEWRLRRRRRQPVVCLVMTCERVAVTGAEADDAHAVGRREQGTEDLTEDLDREV